MSNQNFNEVNNNKETNYTDQNELLSLRRNLAYRRDVIDLECIFFQFFMPFQKFTHMYNTPYTVKLQRRVTTMILATCGLLQQFVQCYRPGEGSSEKNCCW